MGDPLQRKLVRNDLRDVARMIIHNEWKNYARQLDLDETDMQSIEQNVLGPEEQRFQALFNWHKRQSNPTFKDLIDAASAIRLPQLAQDIKELAMKHNSSGSTDTQPSSRPESCNRSLSREGAQPPNSDGSKPILNIFNTWIHNVILHSNPNIHGALIGLLALIFAIQFVLTFAHAYYLDQSAYHGEYSKDFAFYLVLVLRGFTRCGLPLCLLIVTLQIAMKRRSATSPVPQEDFTCKIEEEDSESVLQKVVHHFWNEGLALKERINILTEIQSHFETAHMAMHIGSLVEAIILTFTLWKLEAAFYISGLYKMDPHIGVILSVLDIVTFFVLNLSCGMMFSLFFHEITMKHIVAAVVKVNDYGRPKVKLPPNLKRSAKVTLDYIVSSWTWLELFLYLGVQIYSFILVVSAAAQIPLSYGILGDVCPTTWLIFVSASTLLHLLSTSPYHAPYIRSIGIVLELCGLSWLLWFDTPKFGGFLQILYVTIPGAYLFWYLVAMTRHEYLVLGHKQQDSKVKHYRRCIRNLFFLLQWIAVLIVSITFEYLLLKARAIESQLPVGSDIPLHAGNAETFSRTVHIGSHLVHEMCVCNGNTSSSICSCLSPRGP